MITTFIVYDIADHFNQYQTLIANTHI